MELASEENINKVLMLELKEVDAKRALWKAEFEGTLAAAVKIGKATKTPTKIKVDYLGIVTDKPYDGTLSIMVTPDRRFLLEPGRPYEIEVAGLSFAEWKGDKK